MYFLSQVVLLVTREMQQTVIFACQTLIMPLMTHPQHVQLVHLQKQLQPILANQIALVSVVQFVLKGVVSKNLQKTYICCRGAYNSWSDNAYHVEKTWLGTTDDRGGYHLSRCHTCIPPLATFCMFLWIRPFNLSILGMG